MKENQTNSLFSISTKAKVLKKYTTSHQSQYKMHTIFMSSRNSKTFNLNCLVRNLTNKINFKNKYKDIACSNLRI